MYMVEYSPFKKSKCEDNINKQKTLKTKNKKKEKKHVTGNNMIRINFELNI